MNGTEGRRNIVYSASSTKLTAMVSVYSASSTKLTAIVSVCERAQPSDSEMPAAFV